MPKPRILVVRKMSALEYYYNGNHESQAINESHNNHTTSIAKIENILKETGKEFDIVTRRELSKDLIAKYEAVISAGGDGTVIATAAYNENTPQLNLRTDEKSFGALCSPDLEKSIRAFLNGNYTLQEWTREDVHLNGKLVGRASNEVCIGEKLRFDKLARYNFRFKDLEDETNKEEYQAASGLIIVTGTGSTAWPKAFKPFPRNSSFLRFITLLQHSGNIESGKSDYFRLEYKGHEGKFAIDTVEYDLPRDSILKIKISKYPLKVIVPN